MKFVHNNVLDVGSGAFTKSDVGEDFSGAAKDGGVAIDGSVAGGQTNILRAKVTAEGHEFLVDQCLDRASVNGALALG